MADLQIGSILGVTARGGKGINGGADDRTGLALTNASPTHITSLRARLTAISATSYTTARLDAMSVNDMIYAVRLADQPTSI